MEAHRGWLGSERWSSAVERGLLRSGTIVAQRWHGTFASRINFPTGSEGGFEGTVSQEGARAISSYSSHLQLAVETDKQWRHLHPCVPILPMVAHCDAVATLSLKMHAVPFVELYALAACVIFPDTTGVKEMGDKLRVWIAHSYLSNVDDR